MIALIIFAVAFALPLALMNRSKYCENVMLGWDTLGSAITGGMPGETISGRVGSAAIEGTFRGKFFEPIVDAIMRRKGHCRGAVLGDKLRAQAVLQDYGRLPSA